MKTLVLCLVLVSPVYAWDEQQDWYDVEQQRQFEQYRWEEQQRFQYEQDRLDRMEYQQRQRYLDEQHNDTFRSLCQDNPYC